MCFQLKIEQVFMCMRSRFHNKLKQLECFMVTPYFFVIWVYLLRTLGSHYLPVCFFINILVSKLEFKYEAESQYIIV